MQSIVACISWSRSVVVSTSCPDSAARSEAFSSNPAMLVSACGRAGRCPRTIPRQSGRVCPDRERSRVPAPPEGSRGDVDAYQISTRPHRNPQTGSPTTAADVRDCVALTDADLHCNPFKFAHADAAERVQARRILIAEHPAPHALDNDRTSPRIRTLELRLPVSLGGHAAPDHADAMSVMKRRCRSAARRHDQPNRAH
jgi:hypothetical protein